MGFKVGVFTRGEETHSYKYEKAFAEGLIEHGHDVIFYNWHDRPVTIDMAVMWSIKNVPLIAHLKEKDVDYVVLERGYIGDREKWTSCGFNGLNGHADFCNKNSGERRLEHVEKYLQPVRQNRGDYIVIMGQVPGDSSVRHIGFNRWLDQTYKEMKFVGEKNLYYRPHPLDRESYIPEGLKIIKGDLQQIFVNAHCIVTLNSNSGVDAILAGVPVFVDDKGSMVWDLRVSISNDTGGVPCVLDRDQWLKNMSYTQWTIEEMSSGETWGHLMKRYEG